MAPDDTLRDYFATAAMNIECVDQDGPEYTLTIENMAGAAYRIADAMLAERIKNLHHYTVDASLRDRFAAETLKARWTGRPSDWEYIANCERMAKSTYEMADAMLAERIKWVLFDNRSECCMFE